MNRMNEPDRSRTWRLALIVVLALAAVPYTVKGFMSFVRDNPQDLHQHWVWEKYFFHREYPPDVVCAHGDDYGVTPIHTGRNDAIVQEVGKPTACPYPPWIFATEMLWLLPKWRATCLLVSAWNLAAFALLMIWAYRVGARFGREEGLFLAISAAAISSICTSWRNGQFGVLMVGFLLAAMLCDERNRSIAAGILLGIASMKPTISAPFFLIFLARRQWSVLAAAFVYLAIAVVAVWAITGAPPPDMLREMFYGQKLTNMDGYGPEDWLKAMGLSHSLSSGIPSVLGIVAGLGIAFAFRKLPLLPLMGMMSVIARLWAYHRHYDNVVLIFLLVALGERALRRKDGFSIAAFLIVGASLWLPAKATEFEIFRAYQMLAWFGGLIALCAIWQREARMPVDSFTSAMPANPLLEKI
jgi:hypothetical protein